MRKEENIRSFFFSLYNTSNKAEREEKRNGRNDDERRQNVACFQDFWIDLADGCPSPLLHNKKQTTEKRQVIYSPGTIKKRIQSDPVL